MLTAITWETKYEDSVRTLGFLRHEESQRNNKNEKKTCVSLCCERGKSAVSSLWLLIRKRVISRKQQLLFIWSEIFYSLWVLQRLIKVEKLTKPLSKNRSCEGNHDIYDTTDVSCATVSHFKNKPYLFERKQGNSDLNAGSEKASLAIVMTWHCIHTWLGFCHCTYRG